MNCQTNDEDCSATSCMNGGTCIDGINSYNCSCKSGFTGSNCQYKINKCDSSPCKNGATCIEQNNEYECHCAYGFQGKQCQSFIDWCGQSPCENGATCIQQKNEFRCDCSVGWAGKMCDVEMVSCKDASQRKKVELKHLCNNGTCENFGNSHKCHCQQGYSGSYCQKEIDECESAPCLNGGICRDLVGAYKCICKKGFQGQNCELNIDDCKPNPCQNGGTCHDLVGGFSCSCPPGTIGLICEVNKDDCEPGACHNNGSCIDKVGGFECRCPPGFVGNRCEGDINECLSNPCSNAGTLDCVQMVNDFHCNCKPGFMGRHCEVKVNFCANSPCLNGGFCSALQIGHQCSCSEGFYGKNCEFSGHDCDSNPCSSGECLSVDAGGYTCQCPFGTEGRYCEIDTIDECLSGPCKQNSRCMNKLGGFECICPQRWKGKTCEVYDKNYNKNVFGSELDYQQEQCLKKGCQAKQGNGRCDEECNTLECDFDGNDCSLGETPWKNCTAIIDCWKVFADGICNEECNTPECLFDGRDCERKLLPCNPAFDSYCQKHYANGFCDYGCNNAECDWDGLDCEEKEPPKLADGVISIVLLMEMQEFKRSTVPFLRDVGHQLRTTVRIKKDGFGNDMIFPWKGKSNVPDLEGSEFAMKHKIHLAERVGQSGVHVYLEIDNRKCVGTIGSECFSSASGAAQYLAATAVKHNLGINYPIQSIRGVLSPEDPVNDPTDPTFVLSGVLFVIFFGAFIGVLVSAKRKRYQGVTWVPEGFLTSSSARRPGPRGPDGQEMRNMNINSSQQWSDDESLRSVENKRRKYDSDHTIITDYEEPDTRVWSHQHMEAAEIRVPPAMMTPPNHHDGNNEIDIRGPCGMTPLMVASIRGGGIDNGEDIDAADESTAQAIFDLVGQGADINARLDNSEETSLHLAARYQRADAAKRLMDLGADVNLQDFTGRTPLHAAVASDAMGVFTILLRNRGTNLNARTHDGTTPLILASRLASEGMVEALITADSDINASDNAGKTALHWAAAVNNVDAVNTLLLHGANRDAQDDKDETPLFLSAREGAFEACKALLDHFANRELPDCMDRLPRDIAHDKSHFDIVRLLDDHVPRSPQMVTVIPNNITTSPMTHQLISQPTVIPSTKQSKNKKRQVKATSSQNTPLSPEPLGDGCIKRKASVKKQSKKQQQISSEPTNMTENVSSNNIKNSTNACNSHSNVIPQQGDQLQEIEDLLSSVESPVTNIPSPYDTTSLYSNAMAAFDIDFLPTLNSNNNNNVINNNVRKKPPSYEECIKVRDETIDEELNFKFFCFLQNSQPSTQSNAESYGYSLSNPFPDHAMQQGGPRSVISSEQGLSPPYSNQSPYSIQSSMALSPHGYISEFLMLILIEFIY